MLNRLTLDSQGTYKCEVSAEAPSFKTKSDSDHMVVVVPPSRSEIVGAQPKYNVGDRVNVTCVSHHSKPAASLNWKVNDREVLPHQFGDLTAVNGHGYNHNDPYSLHDRASQPPLLARLHEYQPVRGKPGQGNHAMETAKLGLSFEVPPSFYPGGLKLECSASIGSVYWQSFQEKIPIAPREQPAVSNTWWGQASMAATPLASPLLIVIKIFIAIALY